VRRPRLGSITGILLIMDCDMEAKKYSEHKIYELNPPKIFCGDVLSFLPTIPDNSVDLVVADPPYFQVFGEFDFGIFKNKEEYLAWSLNWLKEVRRILTNDGMLILWGSVGKRQITFARLAIMIEDNNLFYRQNWVTQRNTRGIGTSKNYISAREDFLFLTKSEKFTFNVPYTEERSLRKDMGANGKPRKNLYKRVTNVWSDITEASQSSTERCSHPTVKALRLCDRFIRTHSNPGETVFIPFVGSGSEIISSINNERNVFGCEISPEFVRSDLLINFLLIGYK